MSGDESVLTRFVSNEDLVVSTRATVAAHNVAGPSDHSTKNRNRVVITRESGLDAVAAVVDYHRRLSIKRKDSFTDLVTIIRL